MVSDNFTNRKIWRLRDLLSRNCPLSHNYNEITVGQGSTNRQVREPTGPNWSEIFKNLLFLVRSEIFKIFRSWPGPDPTVLVRDSLDKINIRPNPNPKFGNFSQFEFLVNFSSSIIRLIYQIIRIINPMSTLRIRHFFIITSDESVILWLLLENISHWL